MTSDKKICTAVISLLIGSALAFVPIPRSSVVGADSAAQEIGSKAKAPDLVPHSPTPPTPNCQCGCTVTGKCVCKDCDHPCLVKVEPAPTPTPASPPYVKLAATKSVKANRYFCIKPNTNCPSVKWVIPVGLDTLDPEIGKKDANAAVLIGDTGSYTVQAYGALGDQASDIASCVVTIGDSPPVPPGPNPPTPPGPTDLTKALQSAYSLDTDSDRVKSLATLSNLYVGMSILAQARPSSANTDWVTWMRGVVESDVTGLGTTKLLNLRKAIGTELQSKWGPAAGTVVSSADAAKELKLISDALAGVK